MTEIHFLTDRRKFSSLRLSGRRLCRRSPVSSTIIVTAMLLCASRAWAEQASSSDGSIITVTGKSNSPIKSQYKVKSVTLAEDAEIESEGTAISLGSDVSIKIGKGARVIGKGKGSGPKGKGPNTIEFGGNSTVDIYGTVDSFGNRQGNAEAIDMTGNGNTITVHEGGVLKTHTGSVTWFERDGGENTLVNKGTIQAGDSGNLSVAYTKNTKKKINFTNDRTGVVQGNLTLGYADDVITLNGGSIFDGVIETNGGNDTITIANGARFEKISAGIGNDTLNLTGDDAAGTVLEGAVTGINTLNKKGTGKWIIDRNLKDLGPGALTVNVIEGNLTLTENNDGYQGKTTVAEEGTLQIGDGGTSGDLPGEIENDGTLVFNRSDAATFSGVITGSGKIRQSGSGAMTLGVNNSYGGGTEIRAGSLTGTAQSFGSGEIVDNAALVIDQDDDGVLANTVSGAGTVTKRGGGGVTLGANNSYGGGTEIRGGSLIGTARSFGSGEIVDNAALVIDQDDDGVLANTVSGAGTVTKRGGGGVTLGANNSYGGGTEIRGGSLIGTARSFGSGEIVDNAALVIDQDDDGVLANTVSGAGTVTKRGGGGVTLGVNNSYGGGTEIRGGSLTGTAQSFGSGEIVDNAALVIDQDDDGVLANTVSGAGTVTKRGRGTVITLGTNSYSGVTHVASGTLRAGEKGTFSRNSRHEVHSGGILDLSGYDQTVASIANSGTIRLGRSGKGTRLTISGDYVGHGGTVTFRTVLAQDRSNSDKMVVGGDVLGKTAMQVTNVAGLGAKTSGSGIQVVEVNGVSTDDAFTLVGTHIDAGAYEYRLYKGTPSGKGEDWYLRSEKIEEEAAPVEEKTTYRKEVPIYAGLPAQLRQADMLMLGNLDQRIGKPPSAPDRLRWGRFIAKHSKIHQDGVADASTSGHFSGFQIGSDLWSRNDWHVGGYIGYLRGNLDVKGFAGGVTGAVGAARTNAYSLGAYATHTWANAGYLDLVLQGTRHNAYLRPDGNGASTQHGNHLTVSAEAGKSFALGSSNWNIVPQVQAVHQWLNLRDTHISGDTTVSQRHTHAWLLRSGMAVKGSYTVGTGQLNPYARVNLYYSPSGADRVTFATPSAATVLTSGARHHETEVTAGATLEITKNVKAYGEIGRIWSKGGSAHMNASGEIFLGIRAQW